MLQEKGPLLIAANHPNSFLDAIIVGTLFEAPVYSLARGDAFVGKVVNKILNSLNMLPVYRISEGLGNLENNYTTFDACQHLFKQNKIVLIFSEGRCINEWHLRTLKKGTARLALTAWLHDIPLKVLPLGINYNSFRGFGKIIKLNFGEIIHQNDMYEDLASGKGINEFNAKLKLQLEGLVYEIDKNNSQPLKEYFYLKNNFIKKILLFIPALIGFVFHAPLYTAIYLIIKKRAHDHFDSIMTGLIILLYPWYVLLISIIVFFITKSLFSFGLILLFPLTALCFLHFKNPFSKIKNR